MRQWFVGTTKDQQELLAAANLRAQGYAAYLPKIYLRHQDGKKVEARALLRFTGYIFVAFDRALEQHGPISGTRGMASPTEGGSALICNGSKPAPLPPGFVERMRAIEDEELGRALARKKPLPRLDLVHGARVQIAGDRDHPAFGRRGQYLFTERGVAHILEGFAIWHVPEGDLRRLDLETKKAA